MKSNGDDKADQVLLAVAYWLRVLCSYEAEPNKQLLIEDVTEALKVWDSRESTQCDELTLLPLLYHVADLLSLKGYMELHAKIYMAVILLLEQNGKRLEDCLAMLWQSRSLSHALCTSPLDDSFLKALAFHNPQCAFQDFWIKGMATQKSLQVGFQQSLSISSTLSTLHSIHLKNTESYDDVSKAASDLIKNDPQSNNHLFFAAHLYYDLAERRCAEGRMIEACYNANKALNLREKIYTEYFCFTKENDATVYYGLGVGTFVRPRKATLAWPSVPDPVYLNECLLTPWNVLKAFLESQLQVATMEEMVGNGSLEPDKLLMGKDISSFLDLPIFVCGFSIALAKRYYGQLRFERNHQELVSANRSLQDIVSCCKCKKVWCSIFWKEAALPFARRTRLTTDQGKKSEALQKATDYYIKAGNAVRSKSWQTNEFVCGTKKSERKMNLCGALLNEDDSNNHSERETIQPKKRAKTGETGSGFSKVECWHCVPSKITKSTNIQHKIDMKWEFVRRRLFLRLRIDIEHMHMGETSEETPNLQKILSESISVLGSRNMFDSIRVSGVKKFLVDLIQKEIKTDVFAIEQASILYNTCWFSLRSICSKVKRNNEYDTSFLPIHLVEAGLKLSFIICSEVPHLFQKVSRMLAVLYIVSSSGEKFPNLSSSTTGPNGSKLAAFFHQASIGAGFNNNLFSHVRKQKDLTDVGSSCATSTCLRLAPESVRDLEAFIQKFFEGLPCVATICLSIIRDDYPALLLPKKCSAWVMVSRVMSKEPLVILLPIDEPIKGTLVEGISTEFSFAKSLAKRWPCPWGYSIIDEVAPLLKDIHEYTFVMEAIPTIRADTQQMVAIVEKNEIYLAHLVSSIQDLWFGSWKHLLLGDGQKNKNIKHLLNELKNGCYIGEKVEERMEGTVEPVDGEPVILVFDSEIEMVPWESLPILKKQNQEAYRMPSVACIKYTIEKCRSHNEKDEKENDFTVFPICDPKNASYYLNCSNIPGMENHFRGWLKNQYTHGWGGAGISPTNEEIITVLKKRDLLVYVGHGDPGLKLPFGEYIDRWPAALLMGCGSVSLNYKGSYNPTGAQLDFLIAGAPFVVGMLWPVNSDAKNVVEVLLEDWMTTRSSSWAGCKLCGTNVCRHRKMIGGCIEKGRESCVYTHATGAAMICYGVPTYIYKA